MQLNVDLNNVPDTIPVPGPGIYDFTIAKPPEVKPAKNDANKNVVHIEITLDSDNEHKGRTLMDWVGIDSDMGKVRLKRLFKSMGIELTGTSVDLADLVNKRGRCVVTNQVDTSSGVQQMRANVGNYLIPGDQGYGVAAGK